MILAREVRREDETMEDRRTFARIPAEVLLRCREEDVEKPGVTMDVSAQGLGVLSTEWLKPSAQVDICIRFPYTKDEYNTSGRVVWCHKAEGNKFRIGIALDRPELMLVSQLLNGGHPA